MKLSRTTARKIAATVFSRHSYKKSATSNEIETCLMGFFGEDVDFYPVSLDGLECRSASALADALTGMEISTAPLAPIEDDRPVRWHAAPVIVLLRAHFDVWI